MLDYVTFWATKEITMSRTCSAHGRNGKYEISIGGEKIASENRHRWQNGIETDLSGTGR